MIAIVLHPQLRRNILAYVDDIVVKSVQRRDHISDLAETFVNLKAANLRLNPEKCVFGIHKEKVLGRLVSTKGIEANPDKIKALIEMHDPVSVKDLQKLTGRVATLNKFILRVAERSLPFFQFLRSSYNFQWSETQKQALQELKDYLSDMTKLCHLKPKSPLILYLSASNSVVSDVLVQEKEEEGRLGRTTTPSTSSSKSRILRLPTMPFSADRLSPSSWWYLTTPTWYSKCQVLP
jgi:hypothetical protein